MPCLSGIEDDHAYELDRELQAARSDVRNLEAALCAILTALDARGEDGPSAEQIIASIDQKESGVSPRQISSWFASHKKKDQARRAKEKEQLRQAEEAAEVKSGVVESLKRLPPHRRTAALRNVLATLKDDLENGSIEYPAGPKRGKKKER